MLTNSCVKLQTVHTIPMTMNKEGEVDSFQGLIHILISLQFCIYLNLSNVNAHRR